MKRLEGVVRTIAKDEFAGAFRQQMERCEKSCGSAETMSKNNMKYMSPLV